MQGEKWEVLPTKSLILIRMELESSLYCVWFAEPAKYYDDTVISASGSSVLIALWEKMKKKS